MSTNQSKAIHLDTAEFDALVKSCDKPVLVARLDECVKSSDKHRLVDFWAQWCAPCRALGPTIDELAGEFADRATVAKVDIEASPELASRFGVASIPTVIVFRDGKIAERVTGIAPKERLADLLETSIAAA